MGSHCCKGNNHEHHRNFLTKQEKIEMLKEHHEMLKKETQGVEEKIKELEA